MLVRSCLGMCESHHTNFNLQDNTCKCCYSHCVDGTADAKKALFLLHIDANSVSLGADTARFLMPGTRCTPLLVPPRCCCMSVTPAASIALACFG